MRRAFAKTLLRPKLLEDFQNTQEKKSFIHIFIRKKNKGRFVYKRKWRKTTQNFRLENLKYQIVKQQILT